MVQEVRDIILSLDEVFTAYDCYKRITPEFIPEGKIISCWTGPDSIILNVEITSEGKSKNIEKICKGLDVLRPMIRFCIENNIMLPRAGKKTILIKQNQVHLHIELDMRQDMPTSTGPMYVKHMDNLTQGSAQESELTTR